MVTTQWHEFKPGDLVKVNKEHASLFEDQLYPDENYKVKSVSDTGYIVIDLNHMQFCVPGDFFDLVKSSAEREKNNDDG